MYIPYLDSIPCIWEPLNTLGHQKSHLASTSISEGIVKRGEKCAFFENFASPSQNLGFQQNIDAVT